MSAGLTRPLLYEPPLWPLPLEDTRKHLFPSDRGLFGHIGFFVVWYGACEAHVDNILMRVSQIPNAEIYCNLTLGMDAGVKTRRLLAAFKLLSLVPSKPLTARLKHFSETIVGLRNRLVHQYLIASEDGRQLEVHSVATATPNWPQAPARPEKIMALDLFERALWLRMFADDLFDVSALLDVSPPVKELGIPAYRSGMPVAP